VIKLGVDSGPDVGLVFLVVGLVFFSLSSTLGGSHFYTVYANSSQLNTAAALALFVLCEFSCLNDIR